MLSGQLYNGFIRLLRQLALGLVKLVLLERIQVWQSLVFLMFWITKSILLCLMPLAFSFLAYLLIFLLCYFTLPWILYFLLSVIRFDGLPLALLVNFTILLITNNLISNINWTKYFILYYFYNNNKNFNKVLVKKSMIYNSWWVKLNSLTKMF